MQLASPVSLANRIPKAVKLCLARERAFARRHERFPHLGDQRCQMLLERRLRLEKSPGKLKPFATGGHYF
jgi:hypothetical protein